MAATQTVPALLTIEEYLNTSYRPDCEFVDGHLEERIMGPPKHAVVQLELGFWFLLHRGEWKIRVMNDARTRVSKTRVRLPDVAVFDETVVVEDKAMNTPPFLAIEVLSPEDRIPRVIPRLDDYLDMGVGHIWVIDPIKRLAYTYTRGDLRPLDGSRLTIPGSLIYVDLPELFASLDGAGA